jgi:hypothetical protein
MDTVEEGVSLPLLCMERKADIYGKNERFQDFRTYGFGL